MQIPPENKKHWQPAPCHGARHLLIIAIGASASIMLAIAADGLLRVPDQDASASAWMREFSLSAPALWPAGHPKRHPETLHPGVDLRLSPGLVISP